MFLAILLVLFTAVLFFFKWINMRPKNFPPGPMPLPFIGSVYNFPSKHIWKSVNVWSKKYGQTIGYMFGSTPTVFVTGVDNVMAALRKEEFQGRPDSVAIRNRSFGKRFGVFLSDGEQWSESRRFAMKHLRSLGQEQTENLMKDEIDELLNHVKDNTVVQGNGLFSFPAVNVIWTIISNKRFSMEDEKARVFLDNLNKLFRLGRTEGDIVTMFPIMRFIDPKFKLSQGITTDIQNFMRYAIREHRKTLDYNCPRDMIDNYLVEMELRNKAGTNTTYSEEDLIVICMDLFSAGAESTSNTIEFIIMYMILYPGVQKKLHDELDQVLQRSRRPNLDDKNQLPYTMAVINETIRINTVSPSSVPHRCTSDTKFNDYFIPKDTSVIMDLWSLGHSEEQWTEPDKFDPSRFIDDNGQLIKYSFFHPFGLAKRTCIGESIARNSIYLFVATFFERFSVNLPRGDPLPSTEALIGFTTAPKPFRVNITSRY